MRLKQGQPNPLARNVQASLGQGNISDADLGSHLEDEALSNTIMRTSPPALSPRGTAFGDFNGPTTTSQPLNTLATLVILCTAYIACGNSRSFLVCLEQAFLIAKMLSVELSFNEEFVFLVHYLGFIHTTAMLSPGEYELKAPDFLTILPKNGFARGGDQSKSDFDATLKTSMPLGDNQSDADTRSRQLERLAVQRILRDFHLSCFDDITPTTGISNSVAALLYQVGRLSRLKSAVLGSQSANENQWFWGTFEADAESLELQLGQMLRHRNNQSMIFETSARKLEQLEQLNDDYKDDNLQQTIGKNRYNDALVHCVRIIYMAKIKNTGDRDERVLASAKRVLSTCSSIDSDSHTAGLLVFPLYTAGLYTDDLEARLFVRQRLISLNDRIVTDTHKLVQSLDRYWQNAGGDLSDDQEGMLFCPKTENCLLT